METLWNSSSSTPSRLARPPGVGYFRPLRGSSFTVNKLESYFFFFFFWVGIACVKKTSWAGEVSRSGRVKWRVRQSTQHLREQSLPGTTTQRKRYLSILTVCSNALKAVSVVTTVCPVGPLSACLSACLSVWLRWFDGLLSNSTYS